MGDAKSLPTLNVLAFPKSIELEQRLARAEVTIAGLRETMAERDAEIAYLRDTVSLLQRRLFSLQAQLDHLLGKIQAF